MSFIKKYWTNGFNLFRIRLFLSISTYVMQFCIIAATFLRFLFAKNMHAQNHKKELWECSHILTNPNIGNCNVTIGFSPPPPKKKICYCHLQNFDSWESICAYDYQNESICKGKFATGHKYKQLQTALSGQFSQTKVIITYFKITKLFLKRTKKYDFS